MQRAKSSFSNAHVAPQAPLDTAASENQLSLALSDGQINGKNPSPAVAPVHHGIHNALRGFKLTDLFAIVFGFIAAGILDVAVSTAMLGEDHLHAAFQNGLNNIGQSLVVGLCLIGWFSHKGHYRMRIPFWTETKHIVEATGFAMLVDIFFRFLVKQDFSRLWMISGWVFAGIGIAVCRSLWRGYQRRHGTWEVATLLIGGGDAAEEARNAVTSERGMGFKIVGQVEDLPTAFRQAGFSWGELCAKHNADYVIIALEGAELMHTQEAFASSCAKASLSQCHHLCTTCRFWAWFRNISSIMTLCC